MENRFRRESGRANLFANQFQRLDRRFRLLTGDRRGASLIIFGISLPILIGFIGLSVEVSFWYLEKRELQEAVDSAAMAGAYELLQDSAVGQPRLDLAGDHAVDKSGFVVSPTELLMQHPPQTGLFINDDSAVEATLTRTYNTHFVNVIGVQSVNIQTRAVAKLHGGDDTTACILSLFPCFTDPNEGPGIQFQGSLDLDAPGCAIHSSDACQGINVPGNPDVEAVCITADGGVDAVDYDALEGTSRDFVLDCGFPQIQTAGPTDPYEMIGLNDLTLPDCGTVSDLLPPPGGIADVLDVDGVTVIERRFRPGRYCAEDLTAVPPILEMQILQQGRNVLESGFYYVERDILINGADGALVCEGVCIFVQPPNNADATADYTFDFRGDGDLILKAPTDIQITNNQNALGGFVDTDGAADGVVPAINQNAFALLTSADADEWAGITLANFGSADIGDPNNCANKLNGNGVMEIFGAIYFPDTCIVMTGNLSTDVDDCFQLIGGNITLAGNLSMNITGCDDSFNLGLYPPIVGLVE